MTQQASEHDEFVVSPEPRSHEQADAVSGSSATVRAMTEASAADDPLHAWDPRRRAALEHLWARFEQAGDGGTNLGDEVIAERRRAAAAEDELVAE